MMQVPSSAMTPNLGDGAELSDGAGLSDGEAAAQAGQEV